VPCTHAASFIKPSRLASLDQLCRMLLLSGDELIQPAKASFTAPDYAREQTLGAAGALPAATSTGAAAVMPALPAALSPAVPQQQVPAAGHVSSVGAKSMATPATVEEEVAGGPSGKRRLHHSIWTQLHSLTGTCRRVLNSLEQLVQLERVCLVVV
jgi:hypothetical protein